MKSIFKIISVMGVVGVILFVLWIIFLYVGFGGSLNIGKDTIAYFGDAKVQITRTPDGTANLTINNNGIDTDIARVDSYRTVNNCVYAKFNDKSSPNTVTEYAIVNFIDYEVIIVTTNINQLTAEQQKIFFNEAKFTNVPKAKATYKN